VPVSVPPPYFQPAGATTNHYQFTSQGAPQTHPFPYNSLILGIKKPNGTYHLVQDLRLINNTVKPIHPLVPNPYTILSSIPATSSYFSVLDLKDAFFTIPLSPKSQELFAFTWMDPRITDNNSPGRSSLRVLRIDHICLDRH
jgi:hypothetical protein